MYLGEVRVFWLVLDLIIAFIDTTSIQLVTSINYSATAISTFNSLLLHTLVSSVYKTLHWSFPGNGFIIVSLYLQVTYEVFFA
jgi:hypothetical protein